MLTMQSNSLIAVSGKISFIYILKDLSTLITNFTFKHSKILCQHKFCAHCHFLIRGMHKFCFSFKYLDSLSIN